MHSEMQGERARSDGWGHIGTAGAGILRVTLLFGFVAVALALILTPLAENRTRTAVASYSPLGLDRLTTGSTSGMRTYTVRRSVLQQPGAVCVIRSDGSRTGDC